MDAIPTSECCDTPMPNYPDDERCPNCGEHADAIYEMPHCHGGDTGVDADNPWLYKVPVREQSEEA